MRGLSASHKDWRLDVAAMGALFMGIGLVIQAGDTMLQWELAEVYIVLES
jgi:hypothetical protein